LAPPASADAKAERGVVIGMGTHVEGDKKVMWSTDPSGASSAIKSASLNVHSASPTIPGMPSSGPVIATAPVTVMPSTGGAPVMVMPTGPVVPGGIVTGMPVTGGAPVMGMPTGPVMGVPAGPPGMGGGGGARPAIAWAHLLRLQAGNKSYSLECSDGPCAVDEKKIELGDTLTIRVNKKWAYVTFASDGGAKEEKFKILNEKDDEPMPDAK
jgi:hypothetical protein